MEVTKVTKKFSRKNEKSMVTGFKKFQESIDFNGISDFFSDFRQSKTTL
jgi:hypothetical protein